MFARWLCTIRPCRVGFCVPQACLASQGHLWSPVDRLAAVQGGQFASLASSCGPVSPHRVMIVQTAGLLAVPTSSLLKADRWFAPLLGKVEWAALP